MELDYGIYHNLVEQKYQELLDSTKSYLSDADYKTVKLAYTVASHAHYTQKRKTGEPYITHPNEVANIIARWRLDAKTIAAALLHDVIEDTEVTADDLTQVFGIEITNLVDSVTKLEKIHFESEQIAHAEYFRKVVLAMAKDIRVIIIKLADRLHNMLTLSSMKPEKRKKISLETLEIYAPIANRIGLHKIYLHLAEECFKHLHPLRYKIIQKAVNKAQTKRLVVVEEILQNVKNGLRSNGITGELVCRQRTIYHLYKRMQQKKQSFERTYNSFEINIILNNIGDCYLTLGVLHSIYQPIPGRFKDYIAIPKSNGYQSIHSTLMGPYASPLQIHIRTKAMENIAEYGIMSQLLHQNTSNNDILSNITPNKIIANNWINNILDIQSNSFSANEFLDSIKKDLHPGDIFVFTPKGKIITLPKGATPIDFAYAIHNNLGDTCASALINQKQAPLSTKLQNGDIIHIIGKENNKPSEEWLNHVASGRAISRIKQLTKLSRLTEEIANAEELLNIAFSLLKSDLKFNNQMVNLIKKYYPQIAKNDILSSIGSGKLSAINVAKQILGYDLNDLVSISLTQCINDHSNITIIQDSKCLPLPEDTIFAKITRNKELILHYINNIYVQTNVKIY